MTKEYLEAFKKISEIYGNTNSLEGTYKYFLTIKEALQRLEAIDNAEPSEALECVDDLENFYIDEYVDRYDNNLQVIKRALLKAQEPKKYLKWEDLEFKEKTSRIEVKLNETLYTLSYVKGQYLDFVYLINNDSQIRLNSANDIQFFNDLRLERVEE